MFTTILFYFIVVMLIAGIAINFILWMVELKDSYKQSVAHKRMTSKLVMGKSRIKAGFAHLKPNTQRADIECSTLECSNI